MKRIVKGDQVVPLDRFPLNIRDVLRNPDLLRPYCFVPLDPTLTDDGYCLVFDFDGFVEWFPEWNAMYPVEDNDDWYRDDEGAKYLAENLDRTVDIVKGVIE